MFKIAIYLTSEENQTTHSTVQAEHVISNECAEKKKSQLFSFLEDSDNSDESPSNDMDIANEV